MQRPVPAYGVFIIESMDWKDELEGNLDGHALSVILKLSKIPYEYIYVRTRIEFEHAMEFFRKSDFGFLHISCHGNEEGLCLTIDDLGFEELGDIMGPYLKYRRLFLSACHAASFSLAQYFIPRHHCYSIMGPSKEIDYDKAAIFWSSYYYLMYRDDDERMWQSNIIPTLENVTRTFNEQLNYFSIITERNPKSKTSLCAFEFNNGKLVSKKVIKTAFENLYWNEAIANPDPSKRPGFGDESS